MSNFLALLWAAIKAATNLVNLVANLGDVYGILAGGYA